MNNKEIFNEMFFKKASYEDRLKKKMPQYEPVDTKSPINAFQVSDTEEVKKRLAGTFGVAFGNNNIKNMASRALKTFPILISDNVDPNTAIMLKKLVEEQYAEYINLMISNQVVNLTDYRANDPDGNIALQAVDNISGTDFTSSRIANTAARTKKINADTLFANIPLYQLLRENNGLIHVDDTILESLLKDVCIIPSEHEDALVDFILTESDDIIKLNEASTADRENPHLYDYDRFRNVNKNSGLENANKNFAAYANYEMTKDIAADIGRGFQGIDADGKEIYTKISTADIVLDQSKFNAAINKTVGEMLIDPQNKEIRDKFEKATFLLQSRKIAGLEYYNYLTLRLGIPVSDEARRHLATNFKFANITKNSISNDNNLGVLNKKEIATLASNEVLVKRTVALITKVKLSDVVTGIAVSGVSAVGGATIGSLVLGMSTASLFAPAIIGAAVGATAYLLIKLLKNKNKNKYRFKTEGWERVERLINELDKNRMEVINGYTTNEPENFTKVYDRKKKDFVSPSDVKINIDPNKESFKNVSTAFSDTQALIKPFLTEGAVFQDLHFTGYTDMINESVEALKDINMEICEELAQDKAFVNEFLSESKIKEMKLKIMNKGETKNRDVMVTPAFMAGSEYAYGSTEIERKENKDRKYNQPLIMTIRFKERFANDKSADNELTAVIGILGKIIRIPSEEMEYILNENVKGNTIEGIFKGGDNLINKVSELLNNSKIAAASKALPTSGEIWHNLERVATLAAANEISGRRNNNLSNAHIIFSQKEIDTVRHESGVDYLRDIKKASSLMRRYSAFTLMVANDAGQRVAIFDDPDNLSWDVVPYSSIMGKDSGDQLNAMLNKMMRL